MKKLLLCSLFLPLTFSTFAQIPSPIESTTKDGRTVILKPDGTWEFKKAVPQPSPTPIPDEVKQKSISFAPGFTGDDLSTLFNRLIDMKKRFTKSEFETTAQYEKRLAAEIQKPILNTSTIKDTFTLLYPVESEYDADFQKMKFSLRIDASSYADILQRKPGSLSSMNRYSIYSVSTSLYFDDINGLKLTSKDYWKGFSTEVSLGVEEAKRLKNAAMAAVVISCKEPYALQAGQYTHQVQGRLIDVYFFDQQTGKILAKMSDSKK
ncbi:MAG: hypothetical protein ACKVQJ_11015 [Pyrinomonadaceae bacterium]